MLLIFPCFFLNLSHEQVSVFLFFSGEKAGVSLQVFFGKSSHEKRNDSQQMADFLRRKKYIPFLS